MHPIIMAAMMGNSALPSVHLTGTAVSPNTDSDFSLGGEAQAGWRFQSDGVCDRYSDSSPFEDEWFGGRGSTTTPDQTYYLRATLEAGSDPLDPASSATGSWLALSSSRTYFWSAGPGFQSTIGTVKIEIATDSGGTDIIATGYYRGNADAEL